MSQTFGERISEIEEKLDHLSRVVEALLQGFGFITPEGDWIEDDGGPAALPGD